jgi:hypothetical protein
VNGVIFYFQKPTTVIHHGRIQLSLISFIHYIYILMEHCYFFSTNSIQVVRKMFRCEKVNFDEHSSSQFFSSYATVLLSFVRSFLFCVAQNHINIGFGRFPPKLLQTWWLTKSPHWKLKSTRPRSRKTHYLLNYHWQCKCAYSYKTYEITRKRKW